MTKSRSSDGRFPTLARAFLIAGFVCATATVYLAGVPWIKPSVLLPWWTLIYTSAWEPKGSTVPPASFKSTSVRVVFSLTTMPNNVVHLRGTLDSLVAQTFRADEIFVAIPRMSARTGVNYTIPVWLDEYKKHGVTTLSLPVDFGPATKLIGALEREKSPSPIVITFDDDKIYAPHIAQKLVWLNTHHPGIAFGACGYALMPVDSAWEVIAVYVLWFMRGRGRYVDVLQGVCGNVYRVGFFHGEEPQTGKKRLQHLMQPPTPCFTTDDIWIAGHLAMRGIPRVLLGDQLTGWSPGGGGRFDPETVEWKRHDTTALSKLDTWKRPRHSYDCIEAVEHEFGQKWPRAVDKTKGPSGARGAP